MGGGEDFFEKEGRIEIGGEVISEIEVRIETDIDWLDSGWIGSKYYYSNSKDESNMDDSNSKKDGAELNSVVEHTKNLKSYGLLSLKIRPTWKRLARMVYGPNGRATIELPTLGKHGVQ